MVSRKSPADGNSVVSARFVTTVAAASWSTDTALAAVFSLCDFDDFVLDEATVLFSAAADSPLLYPYIRNEITKINIPP